MYLFIDSAVVKLRRIDSEVNFISTSYIGIDDEKQGNC